MKEKERLDNLVFAKKFAPSREQAKALIMSGIVYVNGQKEDKPGTEFATAGIKVEVRGSTLRFVSRGGLKLEKALSDFPIDLSGNVCLDIGASTGGFTDCMLQAGAVKVYAVDVGYGQLDWKLRNDERVVSMEKTNFRYMKPTDLPEQVDFASCDVAFISLDKILEPARALLKPEGSMICLIKPQFEAGREKVGKKGVVRDPSVHEEVSTRIINLAYNTGFDIAGLTYSPIRGPEGNIEYLLYLKNTDRTAVQEGTEGFKKIASEPEWDRQIKNTVKKAHQMLQKG